MKVPISVAVHPGFASWIAIPSLSTPYKLNRILIIQMRVYFNAQVLPYILLSGMLVRNSPLEQDNCQQVESL